MAVTDQRPDAPHEPEAAGHGLVKPRLRGWQHLVMLPVTVVAGVVLVALAPDVPSRIVAGVFAASAATLFGVSALYHRRTWSEHGRAVMKRIDHSSIFLIIAGTYTPFAVLLLPPDDARLLLVIVWSGAILGILFRVFWVGAPRWLYTPVYIALGWVAVGFLPGLWSGGGPLVVFLLALGGVLYSGGAVVYALKRPNPVPGWFGHHEIFHTCTVLAFLAHYVGTVVVLGAS